MTFETNRWNLPSQKDLKSALEALSATNSDIEKKDVDYFIHPYQMPSRIYHDDQHAAYMGQIAGLDTPSREGESHRPEDDALLQIIGFGHDAVYMHVDGAGDTSKILTPAIQEKIGHLISMDVTDGIYSARLTESGKADSVTNLVADMFGMRPDETIAHNKGGNEFVSALAAAKWMQEKDVPLRFIAVVAQAIAATYPFQPAQTDEMPDGHMEQLAQNLKAANDKYNLAIPSDDIHFYTQLSTYIANQDIAPFYDRDWKECAYGTVTLYPETSSALRTDRDRPTVHDIALNI